MKKVILSLLLAIFIIGGAGCADKRIVLVPQSSYMPTFPTQDFNTSKKYPLEYWVETEDVNGTTITYLVADEKPALGFIKDTKELRSNYNLLLNKIIEFNLKIEEMNKIQNKKEPTEIDDIDDSFFK